MASLANTNSLERYINRTVLFVQGIDKHASKNEVMQVLGKVCRHPQQGRIDILTGPDGTQRGTAFLNYHSVQDAATALAKWRFSLELRGRPLRLQFSSDREFKDIIQGPTAARFKVLVRNVPEELGQEELFDVFSEYGEVLQVFTSRDNHDQYYAILQYIEISAVQQAARQGNRQKLLNNIITVEQYKPNAPMGLLPKSLTQPQAAHGPSGTSPGQGPAAAAGSEGPGPLRGMTFAALQQMEQEREEARARATAHGRAPGRGGAERVGGGADGRHERPVDPVQAMLEEQRQALLQLEQQYEQQQQPEEGEHAQQPAAAYEENPYDYDGGGGGNDTTYGAQPYDGGQLYTDQQYLEQQQQPYRDGYNAYPQAAVAEPAPLQPPPPQLPPYPQQLPLPIPLPLPFSLPTQQQHQQQPQPYNPLQSHPAVHQTQPQQGGSQHHPGVSQQPPYLPPSYHAAAPAGPAAAVAPFAPSASSSAATAALPATATAGTVGVALGAGQAAPRQASLHQGLRAVLALADRLSEMLCCPITHEPLRDPVVAADGHTYERAAITAWLAGRATSPLTNEPLPHKLLLPNKLVKELVAEVGAGNGGGSASGAAAAGGGGAGLSPAR